MTPNALSRAEAFLSRGMPVEALAEADSALADAPDDRQWLEIRLRALLALGRFETALEVGRYVVRRFATDKALTAHVSALEQSLALPAAGPRSVRGWESSIPVPTHQQIQQAIQRYEYRGLQMVKHPLDIALYLRLFWELTPQTIIEIGSKAGGSAIFLGDLLELAGTGSVVSFDVFPVEGVIHPRVSFRFGNGQELGAVITRAELDTWPHPWLVIEDADHSYRTSFHVLNFFHEHLNPGDWVVVEDAILSTTFPDSQENGMSGPERAIRKFLETHGDQYRIADEYCDFFGYNATANVNGYLEFVG